MSVLRGAPRKLGRAELALAYELHAEGVYWKIIAWGLGVNQDYLESVVGRCKREGLDWLPEVDHG